MRRGMTPTEAATDAIQRVANFYPKFSGAILAIDKFGNHGITNLHSYLLSTSFSKIFSFFQVRHVTAWTLFITAFTTATTKTLM
jgi:hypothetical protein